MKDLGEFFGINWTKNPPLVFLVKDRKSINEIIGQDTADWLVGWGSRLRGGVFLLSKENYEKESINKYSDEKYYGLLKHELAHCFADILTGDYRRPVWLSEGLAQYLSGECLRRGKPVILNHFLDYFETEGEFLYRESGFAVELLIKKFGKEKLLELLRKINESRPFKNSEFGNIFEIIYQQKLSYSLFK
ncbi:MAG TPA: hypothetical protein PKI75_02870 [Candidatus Woesebacteria bacterium]|nr:hypothetical protein [Candidatus Woesebacteria bacterium]